MEHRVSMATCVDAHNYGNHVSTLSTILIPNQTRMRVMRVCHWKHFRLHNYLELWM
jgi:hypothetical protein